MCYHLNRLIEATLMCAHNIPFLVLKKKIKLNYPKSAAMGLFSYGLKNDFANSRGKRAISVRAIEVILYYLITGFSFSKVLCLQSNVVK